MLKMPSIWINARVDTSDRGLSHSFKSPGTFANCLTGIKNALVKSLSFSIWAKYARVLSALTFKNMKDWG